MRPLATSRATLLRLTPLASPYIPLRHLIPPYAPSPPLRRPHQVSLQQFLELFDHAIAHSDKAPVASKRIFNIIELLSFHATGYMQRGEP